MLALGGRAFTKGLAERFELPFERAEALKLAAADGEALPETAVPRQEAGPGPLRRCGHLARRVELMIGDLAEGELLPSRIYVCGGGARLPQIGEALSGDAWWRQPALRSPAPKFAPWGRTTWPVSGTRSGMLATRQDVTPMALAHQGLILDAQTSAVERAMRGAVRAMDL